MRTGIYVITNNTNGKRYVGSSVHVLRRWRDHEYKLRHDKHKNKHLQAAWNTYGEEAFTFRVLAWLEKSELRDTEARLIKAWDTTNREKGYNTTEDTTTPIRGWNTGKTLTPEHRRKISESLTGHTVTSATREKLSSALIGKESGNKGRVNSPEHRAKISKTLTGRKDSPDVRTNKSNAQKRAWERRRQRAECQ